MYWKIRFGFARFIYFYSIEWGEKKVIEIDGISMRKKMKNFTNVSREKFYEKRMQAIIP